MFDTITFFWPHTLLAGEDRPGWKKSDTVHSRLDEVGRLDRKVHCVYNHPATGLRATGHGSELHWITVSLPRLVHGANGRLIKSQAETDAAQLRVGDLLSEIARPATPTYRVTRADLVWQLRGDFNRIALAHRNCRHPRIRRQPQYWDGETLRWQGSELVIQFYDKMQQLTKKPGDVIRVEAQLRGGLLKEMLASGEGHVWNLDFHRAYQAYRKLMLGFCPAEVPEVGDLAQLLAVGEAHGWSANGISAFELWARGKNREHVRRMQRQIAALRPRTFGIDWGQLLPPDGPPAPVDVKPPGEVLS